jgi:hypothetical protein
MVTWKNRIFGLCIPVLFIVGCKQGALQQPDVIEGRFLAGADMTALATKLNVIDYYAQTQTGLPAVPDDLVSVDASGTGPWTVFVGFSQFLNGNLIESVSTAANGQVIDFSQIPGSIEVATCDLTGKNCQSYAETFSLAYRPDGGYVPKPDTPVSNFPPPAVAVIFTTALPAASIILVNVLADKISNESQIFMKQIVTINGVSIVSPASNNPVAGTVWFQTK